MNSTAPDGPAVPSNGNDHTAASPPPRVLPFERIVRWMVLAEQALATVALFAIVCIMGAQVFARYFFGSPFSWSEEATKLALIWMTFISSAFVLAQDRHITVDVISHRLSLHAQAWLECLTHGIVTGTCLLLLFGGSHFVSYVEKVGSPSLGIPMPFWYSAVSVGLLLMAVHSFLKFLQVLTTGQPTVRENLQDEEALHLELEPGE